jgi:beta-mannosidase
MDLGGEWLAASSDDDLRRAFADPDFDDSSWHQLRVPGHWRSHPAFAASDGPVLYRRRFTTEPATPGRRTFLTFDGIFYQGDVWLDGEYLGDTEGYFFSHTFEVTAAVAARRQHVLAVEVACSRPSDLTAKRNLTGIFQHWDCIDPDWNPGGIWAPVRLEETGAVRLRTLKVLCRDATAEAATLELEAGLDTVTPGTVTVRTAVRREGMPPASKPGTQFVHLEDHTLAAGTNQFRWRVGIERPELWWPHTLGPQPLYEVEVTVEVTIEGPAPATGGDSLTPPPELAPLVTDGLLTPPDLSATRPPQPAGTASPIAATPPSDRRMVTTGLRHIRIRNFVATINGERLFLKGANCGPTRRALAEATGAELAGDVSLAREAGLDLVRVHAHITRPEFYEAADRQGMLIWQDLPLQWGYGQVRRQAVLQARRAVSVLGHHPSVALWCGHNEPLAVDLTPGAALAPRTVARLVAGQILPSWNKTALDRSIRRALERADGSRQVVAHSGILPHPAWGTDSHLYFGWYHGDERDFPATLARFPVLARFVSEFGAQAVPEAAAFMHPERWPDLDWDDLEAHHALQREIFEHRVPPGRWPTFEGWRAATQEYQATLLRYHIETLRRLKYRPAGGFCVFLLADAQPAVSWAVLDHLRQPKAGYHAVAAACAPVIITAERPRPTYRPGDRLLLDLHAISDLRRPLDGAMAEATVRWPGGDRKWRFSGDVPADSCVRIGRIDHTLPAAARPGLLRVELDLRWDSGRTTNTYTCQITTRT